MNCEINGKHCEMCKINIARVEPIGGVFYLCDNCASTQAIIDSPKFCKTRGCQNEPHDHKAWDSGEYCRKCFRNIEEGADARRCDAQANRIAGLNDDGSMTRLSGDGCPSIIKDGDVDYGRRES
jgi:hypothetical protein